MSNKTKEAQNEEEEKMLQEENIDLYSILLKLSFNYLPIHISNRI